MSKATDDVLAERQRQWQGEDWTPSHDDSHKDRELARMGAAYALQYVHRAGVIAHGMKYTQLVGAEEYVPDDWEFKPKNPRRDLVRAAALLIAEIERIDRAAK